MPIPWAGIGSALSGIGSVASAFSSDKPDYKHLKKGIQWRVNDAKQAGVHPLYALGASVGSPTITTGSTGGDALQALGSVASQYGQATSQKAITAQQIKESEALTQSHLARAARDAMETQVSASNLARQTQRLNHKQDPQIPNLYVPYKDNQTGQTVYLPNPEAGVEMPETIGAYYWGAAKNYQETGKQKNLDYNYYDPYNVQP